MRPEQDGKQETTRAVAPTETTCSQCGACAAFCPTDAVQLEFDKAGESFPRIDAERCNKCGICRRVCAGGGIDWAGLDTFALGAVDRTALGNVKTVYTGFSSDADIRFSAASGGIITTLLKYLLEIKAIDGALVTGIESRHPKSWIATSVDDIKNTTGSVYLVNPALKVLKEIRKRKSRLAVVGLPCQIASLTKAVQAGVISQESIVVTIGLFCGRAANSDLLRRYLDKKGINIDDVTTMRLRGRGWPGTFVFEMRDGTRHELCYPDREYMKMWKTCQSMPLYCLLCADRFARFADLSVGDAWLPEFRSDQQGRSFVIVRSETGMSLVTKIEETKQVVLSPSNSAKVLQGQRAQAFRSHTNIRNTRRLLKAAGHPLPHDINTPNWPSGSLYGLLTSAGLFAANRLSRSAWGRTLLSLLPLSLLVKKRRSQSTKE